MTGLKANCYKYLKLYFPSNSTWINGQHINNLRKEDKYFYVTFPNCSSSAPLWEPRITNFKFTVLTVLLSHLEIKGHHCAVCQTSVQNLPAAVEAKDSVWQREHLLQFSCLWTWKKNNWASETNRLYLCFGALNWNSHKMTCFKVNTA